MDEPSASTTDPLLALYPAVAAVPTTERQALWSCAAAHVQVGAGTVLFDEGSPCLLGQSALSAHGQAMVSTELLQLDPDTFQRLAQALCAKGPVLHTTHQALADELGTVSEIVSRLLNRFERAGWVKLGRERIELAQPNALRRLAAEEAMALG